MEKLIVKNFGPIKEAEIDLTKYVVFIGDTSTGKSVLAKLIAIFRDNDLIFSNNRLIELEKMLNYYNINFNLSRSYFEYYLDDIKIVYSKAKIKVYENGNDLEFDEEQNNDNKKYLSKEALISINENITQMLKNEGDLLDIEKLNEIRKSFEELKEIHKKLPYSMPIYFPAERIIISLVGNTISGLWANNVSLPSYFKDFAASFDFAKNEIKEILFDSFGFKYSSIDDIDFIIFNNEKIRLNKTSSGIQSILPLLLVLENELRKDKFIKNSLLIEEPELNLFPIKQRLLIYQIISRLGGVEHKLIITTHSPYILSSLDTLILAKNTFNENPELKEEINKIVSEDKWIDYDDISVYEVRNDGKVYSIKNEEFKSIDANAIDSVSDVISEEFDKLTELRYAHKQ
jgi:predicted ATPase